MFCDSLPGMEAAKLPGNSIEYWRLHVAQEWSDEYLLAIDALTHENNQVRTLNAGFASLPNSMLAMQAIIEALQHENNKVEHFLLFYYVPLTTSDFDALTSALLHPNCKVREFSLSLTRTFDNAPAKAIAKMLEHRDNKIERLMFRCVLFHTRVVGLGCFSRTVSSGFEVVLSALKHENNKVHVLHLCNENVQVGMDKLVLALMHENNQLKQLTFEHARLGANGVQLLSRGLHHPNCKITALRFDDCRLGQEGMTALADLLMTRGNRIQNFEVSDLGIDVAEARALMGALMHEHNRVQELELDFIFYEAEEGMLFKALNHVNNKVAKFTCRHLSTQEVWAGTTVFRNLFCLLSARQVECIGKRAAVRRLPRELVRMVGEMGK